MKFCSLLALACAVGHAAAAPIRTVIVTQTVWVTHKGGAAVTETSAATETVVASTSATVATTSIPETTSATTLTTQTTSATTGDLLNAILNAAAGGNSDSVDDLFQVSSINVQFGVGQLSSATGTTTSTNAAATTTATTATSTSSTTTSTSTSSASTGTNSGQGTFYDTGLGACGWTNSDSDYIVAIDIKTYNAHNVDSNPNHNSLCGKKIRAFYEGKSVDVEVVDACEGCLVNDLDFSPSAFQQLADESLGRIDITWEWL